MSIDDATPEEWNRVRKTATGKLFHPEDKHIDPVTKPAHYNKGGIEAIDYIKQQLGVGFASYCTGNVHKYLHRFTYKNGIEDLRKARQYLDWLIEELER